MYILCCLYAWCAQSAMILMCSLCNLHAKSYRGMQCKRMHQSLAVIVCSHTCRTPRAHAMLQGAHCWAATLILTSSVAVALLPCKTWFLTIAKPLANPTQHCPLSASHCHTPYGARHNARQAFSNLQERASYSGMVFCNSILPVLYPPSTLTVVHTCITSLTASECLQ
jgi:hypothetical protein